MQFFGHGGVVFGDGRKILRRGSRFDYDDWLTCFHTTSQKVEVSNRCRPFVANLFR